MSILRRYIRAILREATMQWPSITHSRHVNSQPFVMNHYDNQVWNAATRQNAGHLPTEPLRAACCLIIRDDGKILAVSRKDDPTAMGLPGGKVDPGETPEVAAARELKEETGLNAIALKPVFVWQPDERDDNYETTTFMTDVEDLDSFETTETGRVAWVTWETLLAGPFGQYNAQLKEKLGL